MGHQTKERRGDALHQLPRTGGELRGGCGEVRQGQEMPRTSCSSPAEESSEGAAGRHGRCKGSAARGEGGSCGGRTDEHHPPRGQRGAPRDPGGTQSGAVGCGGGGALQSTAGNRGPAGRPRAGGERVLWRRRRGSPPSRAPSAGPATAARAPRRALRPPRSRRPGRRPPPLPPGARGRGPRCPTRAPSPALGAAAAACGAGVAVGVAASAAPVSWQKDFRSVRFVPVGICQGVGEIKRGSLACQ